MAMDEWGWVERELGVGGGAVSGGAISYEPCRVCFPYMQPVSIVQ